ncbi:HemK2/MTQ2 family protein methyltransferase [Streptomyces sp. NPDC001691]|uniref:HemK2/MTQ2 family protein methyltransferase n=1 Tax=unclassified Streptomyces TaxID=2593676 RepID=UPI000DEA4026|nr:HemK2/MTQ2 family protein methyltransferase [Streptomyces sp. SDr-06]RCH67862.1 methyltransferase domain-containing protein [Streptomyces sp. SDr-06]
MNLFALPGVYGPQDDTALLAETLRDEPVPQGAEVLDIGTGTGALALAAARRGARVTAVDISWRAVLSTRLNARLAGLPVNVLRGNLLAPVAERSYDLILSNPPYVPADRPTAPRHSPAQAWDAGGDGRLLLRRICREAPLRLRPGGVLLLVHSALSGAESTLAELREEGLKAAVAARRSIPFGPVLRSRSAWLAGQGLIEDGATTEELVVIRAERPV